MKLDRLKIRDKSSMTIIKYLLVHVLLSILLASGFYILLPTIIPACYYNTPVGVIAICMGGIGVLGIIYSLNYDRNLNSILEDIIIGLGVYTLIFTRQYTRNLWVIALLVVVFFSVVDIFSVMKRKTRRPMNILQIMLLKTYKSVHLIRINASIVAVWLIIFVPLNINLAIGGDTNNYSNEGESAGNSGSSVLAVNEIYGDEYRLSENIDTIKLIRNNDTFQELSYEEKCKVIVAIIQCECRYLGLCEIKIDFCDMGSEVLGTYSHSEKTLTINSSPIENGKLPGGSNVEILNTCLHETRHVYQHLLAEMYESVTPEQRNLLAFTGEGVASWITNFENYNTTVFGDASYSEYASQPIEIDAAIYAYYETYSYFDLIDQLLEKEEV